MSSTTTPAGPSSSSEAQAAEQSPSELTLDRVDAPETGSFDAGSWFTSRRTGQIVLGLVAVAFGLRMWELGERALHHDESLDAWWSWLFRNGNFERYDPVYHGPLRFYITAGFYELFGESEATARLFSALTGTAAVGLPWFLRRDLGRVGTISAATALAISPTMLYYSRFGREDAQMVFLALLAIVLGLAYLRRPRTLTAAGLAFTLAASFAIKESAYLFVMLLVIYLMVVLAGQFDRQTRIARNDAIDEDADFDSGFFGSSLLFATVGLIVAVVVGSRADALFPMIALYMAALSAYLLAAALPRLRAAGITWNWAHAGRFVVAAAVLLQVVRAYRDDPSIEAWSLSPLAVGVGALAIVLAAMLAAVPPLSTIESARSWAATFGFGGAALLAHQWLASHTWIQVDDVGQPLAAATPFTTSPLPLVIGVLIAGGGAALIWASEQLQLPISDPVRHTFGWAVLLAGAGFALNEITASESNRLLAALVIVMVVGAGFALHRSLPRTTAASFEWPPMVKAFGAIGFRGWAIAIIAFVVPWWITFTVWGTVREDWASGFTRAIEYWDSQQEVNRGGQPWFYYLYALPAYEWFFVGLASVGSWFALKRPTITTGLLMWFSVGSLVLYSYAGERMPWLIAHPLLPMLLLAGFGVQKLWKHRERAGMSMVAVVCVAALLATAGTAIRASFPNGADSREILSQAGQATPHLVAALDRLDNIDRLSQQVTGETATLAIGSTNAWPYSWYLRDRADVQWFSAEQGPPTDGSADVIIVDANSINLADFPDYQATRFAMRSWWVPTYNDAGPVGWLNWVTSRELWEQQPNPNFVAIGETSEPTERSLFDTLAAIQDGTDDASLGWVGFTGADGNVLTEAAPSDELDDGRDGCGSVDQFFLVHNDFAFNEQQVFPGPIAEMGPLACASDQFASG